MGRDDDTSISLSNLVGRRRYVDGVFLILMEGISVEGQY
jgi:hypothetical protein